MEQEDVLNLVNKQMFEAAAEATLAAGRRYMETLPAKSPEEAESSREQVLLPLWRVVAALRFHLKLAEDVSQEQLRQVAQERA